jgi:hypothetical protein
MNNLPLLPVLRALSDAKVIRRIATLIMQAFAVAFLLIGVYLVVTMIRGMSGAPTDAVIAGILAMILLLAMCLAIAQVFWLRAGNMRDLPETPYNLLPIASIFMRAGGEASAGAFATMGLLGCLFQWIARINPYEGSAPSFIPAMTDSNPFLAGLLFLVRCSLGAGIAVLIGYFLAEIVLFFVDMLVHTRMIAGQSPTAASPLVGVPTFPLPAPPQYAPPMAPYPQYPGPAPQYPAQYPPATPQYPGAQVPQYPPQQPAPATVRCPTCGTDVTPGAPFCGRCGNPLPGRPPGY